MDNTTTPQAQAEDRRIIAARVLAAQQGPRFDRLMPASVLTEWYYDLRRALQGVLEVMDGPAEGQAPEQIGSWGTRLTDQQALDEIQEMLRDPEWGVGMLEDIRELVERTKRSCANYPDERATWGRH